MSKTSFCRAAHRVDRGDHGGQVAVVEAAGIELAGEVVQHGQPAELAGRQSHLALDNDRYLDVALDHLDGTPARSGGPSLLPRAVPAGLRRPGQA